MSSCRHHIVFILASLWYLNLTTDIWISILLCDSFVLCLQQGSLSLLKIISCLLTFNLILAISKTIIQILSSLYCFITTARLNRRPDVMVQLCCSTQTFQLAFWHFQALWTILNLFIFFYLLKGGIFEDKVLGGIYNQQTFLFHLWKVIISFLFNY